MAWRAAISGLLTAAVLLPPPAPGQMSTPTDEVVILSTYRSYHGANNRPRVRRHAGVDFGAPLGAPVLAAADGLVSRIIDWPRGCGNGVVIEHTDFMRWTVYCHMQGVTAVLGQQVSRGEQIGLLGMSGRAVNIPHVHMELCTSACASHVDGDLSATADPLAIADGCFASDKAYPSERLVLTFPVACRVWTRTR